MKHSGNLLFLLFGSLSVIGTLAMPSKYTLKPRYATQVIAGVEVIDTPIVRAAQEFAREHSEDFAYRHVMRSWLYGALIISKNETLASSVDIELQAVGALLHDLGWDPAENSPLVSDTRRFEVDGAFAAGDFVRARDGKNWKQGRLQLLWDSIALHTQPSLYMYKEPDVMTMGSGIFMDFSGPSFGVEKEEYRAVRAEFPPNDLNTGANSTAIRLCRDKPASTYDTWMQPFGTHFVDGYNITDKTNFELIQKNITQY